VNIKEEKLIVSLGYDQIPENEEGDGGGNVEVYGRLFLLTIQALQEGEEWSKFGTTAA